MQYTPHYNLITVEGTDVVNPLTQMNPNFTDIDAALFANKQASIGSATELTSGTVHAITRSNPDSNYFKFTATSNWTTGDSMSIDGINVSVFLTDGTLPTTGAYIINTEVFGIISGTRVTLYLTNPITSLPASQITFDPTGTSLNATNADAALKELADTWEVETIAGGAVVMMRHQKLRIVSGFISGQHTADETLIQLAAKDYPATNAIRFGFIGTNKCAMGYILDSGVIACSQPVDGFYGFLIAYCVA